METIEETLNRSSPRPWWLDEHGHVICPQASVGLFTHLPSVLPEQAKAELLLAVHAVNWFEPMRLAIRMSIRQLNSLKGSFAESTVGRQETEELLMRLEALQKKIATLPA